MLKMKMNNSSMKLIKLYFNVKATTTRNENLSFILYIKKMQLIIIMKVFIKFVMTYFLYMTLYFIYFKFCSIFS